jgi:hypothetical protein
VTRKQKRDRGSTKPPQSSAPASAPAPANKGAPRVKRTEPAPATSDPSSEAAVADPRNRDNDSPTADKAASAPRGEKISEPPAGESAIAAGELGRWIERAVVGVVLIVLVAGAAGGPGWTAASSHAVLASYGEHHAAAPLYGLLATAAAFVPAGEVGFRLAALNAVLGAVLVAGILRAARALLPKQPLVGVVGAVLLVLAPAFRDAAGFAGPSVLAACGVVWAVAFALEHAREPAGPRVVAALAAVAVAIGAAPWLGLVVGVAIGAWLARSIRAAQRSSTMAEAGLAKASPALLASCIGAFGVLAIAWWLDAIGTLPGAAFDAGAVIASAGRGAGAIVVGIGLAGVAFGAVTALPSARWLAGITAAVALHAAAIDHEAVPLLGLLALAAVIVPGAISRALPLGRRDVVALAAGVPLVGASLVAGAAFGVDDPGAAPAQLAADLAVYQPPGPGVFVARTRVVWAALEYAREVAGLRPDLALVPLIPDSEAETVVKRALVDGIVGSDTYAFGRFDPRRAVPRGRGFQLLATAPNIAAPVPPPARYASAIGGEEATVLALARARYEAIGGRLDRAARAAGLTSRFNASDLAILETTHLVHQPMYGFIPRLDGGPPGPWALELFGDDLAWVAGLELDKPPAEAPAERRLHALWRQLWLGKLTKDDPAIAALGPAAVKATEEMLAALAK